MRSLLIMYPLVSYCSLYGFNFKAYALREQRTGKEYSPYLSWNIYLICHWSQKKVKKQSNMQ